MPSLEKKKKEAEIKIKVRGRTVNEIKIFIFSKR